MIFLKGNTFIVL